jgi:hypothetical protein
MNPWTFDALVLPPRRDVLFVRVDSQKQAERLLLRHLATPWDVVLIRTVTQISFAKRKRKKKHSLQSVLNKQPTLKKIETSSKLQKNSH